MDCDDEDLNKVESISRTEGGMIKVLPLCVIYLIIDLFYVF